jgi:D-alanine transaminase
MTDFPQQAFLNGSFVPLEKAQIHVLDRGFIFGDGVYEVIPVYGRRAFRLDEHLQRLERSLSAIKLANPFAAGRWATLIGDLVSRHPWDDQSVYLQVTRGVAPRNHAFPAQSNPTVFIMSGPLKLPSAAEREHGVAAISLEDFRWLRCDIKSISLLGNCLMRQAAVEAGCREAVLFRNGWLTEGAASNVFVVKSGTLLAPPKDHLILPGITYDVALELARAHRLPHEVRPVSEAETRAADELWLSSSSNEILAITTLDGKPVGSGKPGPVYGRMAALFAGATAAERGLAEASKRG